MIRSEVAETNCGADCPEGVAAIPPRRWIFITWYPYCRRSDAMADRIGARSYLVHYLKFKVPVLAPVKYVLQAFRTLWILLRQRPNLVLVANPPVVAPGIVWLGSKLLRYAMVIDAHSGAFQHSRWNWSLPLQRFLARRSVATLVTNHHMAAIVRAWGARAHLVQDLALNLNPDGPALRLVDFHVVFICTYSVDEPVEAVVEAARRLPDIRFSFTGDPFYAPRGFRATLPPNVRLTGFIPDDQYLALLRGADTIVVLTREDHTMQRGGYEAVALEKPLITSRWPLLMEVFSRGTLHVDNTAEGIEAAIRTVRQDGARLKSEISELKKERAHVSAAQMDNLLRVCEAGSQEGARA